MISLTSLASFEGKVESLSQDNQRVVSGMRTTGSLHLGHYHGVLKNWIKLQHEYECFFFAADWHALTTHYQDTAEIQEHTLQMVTDWLAAGINPGSCRLFVQSKVPEHAELHLLLSMITPLGWLERVPTYKDQQEKLKDKDLSNYGFLGYPLLQSADILIYKAGLVPVGEDQVSHLELCREVARRFNHIYGKESDFAAKADSAVDKIGKKNAKVFRRLLKSYQETGDVEALDTGRALIGGQGHLSLQDRERLFGLLEGGGKVILPEPQPLLTETAKFVGLDGQKMSKSYGNTIALRERPEVVEQKIKVMPTDPARVRRTDPGNPEVCPVWSWHKVYSDETTCQWVQQGCRSASIGCIECKKRVSDKVIEEQAPILERAKEFEENPRLVKEILRDGTEQAREVARETMEEVRDVMGL
jgi:tryptophanyl-tRNA synthetase